MTATASVLPTLAAMPTLADARLSAAERRMLDRFVAVLRERLGDDLISVWLFGSRARGEATGPLSDVDVLVVTRAGRVDERAAWESSRGSPRRRA